MKILKSRLLTILIAGVILAFAGGTGAYAASQINGDTIADNTLDGGEIQNETITSADIDNGTVGSVDIKNESIQSVDIAQGTITAADLDGTVVQYLNEQVTDTKGGLTSETTLNATTSAGDHVYTGDFAGSGSAELVTVNASFDSAEATPVEVIVENGSGMVIGRCATNVVPGDYRETCSFSVVGAGIDYNIYVSTPGASVSTSVKASATVV